MRTISTSKRKLLSRFFSLLQNKAPKEIYAIPKKIVGEHAPSYATIKNWVALFKCSEFSTCDAPRPGRPVTVTTLEIIDQIQEVILEDCWISAKSIASHVSGLGPSFITIWTYGSSLRSSSQNA
jgi:hypothetical protein